MDILGSIVAGGNIGPTGVIWSGTDSEATIVAGEQVYLDCGVLASDTVTLIGGGAGSDDVSLNPDAPGAHVSVVITTAGGVTAAGRTSDGSHGKVYIYGEAGVEMMGHLYSGANKSLLFDAEGNLIKEVIDWNTSIGGDVTIESRGQVFIGGWAQNERTEVVLGSNVILRFAGEGTATVLASATNGEDGGARNLRLVDLIDDIAAALSAAVGDTIRVRADQNRVVFGSDAPFTLTPQGGDNVGLLGFLGGNLAATEVVPDALYRAPDVPLTLGTPEDVTLVVNRGSGELLGQVTFTVLAGMTLEELVALLNAELDNSSLNDFRVIAEAGKLVFTNAFDFQLDAGSVNVDVLGMTDVVGARRSFGAGGVHLRDSCRQLAFRRGACDGRVHRRQEPH